MKRLVLTLFATLSFSGCQGFVPAGAGTDLPPLKAAGWTNDSPPNDLSGKVIVLIAFATW